MIQQASRRIIAVAQEEDRAEIYRLRHAVYARELGQHAENSAGALRDPLDEINSYIVGREGSRVAGFISVTPPDCGRFSIDKYISRRDLPFPFDEGLFEVRLLTVIGPFRGGPWASLLMYAALRWVEEHGGRRIVAIGRNEVVAMYERAGLVRAGFRFQSGAVTFELMSAPVTSVRRCADARRRWIERIRDQVDWRLEFPMDRPTPCVHGGAAYESIGDEFATLGRRERVINADVLDAWFPPAPGVLHALGRDLSWLVRSSPPTSAEGLIRVIARTRGVPADSVVVGGGSSDLIYRAFPRWLTPDSRVLILDPMYGEYAHVLENVVGCRVDRLPLDREDRYRLDPTRLLGQSDPPWDLIVIVNPNNPTGRHVPHSALEKVLRSMPGRSRVWIDEAYVDFAGPQESLEPFAARSENVVVCKSMSKVYALSGVRCAYLCAPGPIASDLRRITPPWVAGLPAQMAGVFALQDPQYYRNRYDETAALRARLAAGLENLGLDVVVGHLNSVLVHLPPWSPESATVVKKCRESGLFLRDLSDLSIRMGDRALRIAVKEEKTNQRMLEILSGIVKRPVFPRSAPADGGMPSLPGAASALQHP